MKSVKMMLLLAGVAGATFLGGCSKDKMMADIAQTVQAQQNGEKDGDEVTSQEDYEKVFMELAAHLDEKTTMQVTTVEGGYVFKLLTQ